MSRYPERTTFERWADKVLVGDDCWEWAASHYREGYGQFSMVQKNGKWAPTHAQRAGYELMRGPIPDGLFVCHRCDNPGCVKPSHLFLGTHSDNMADMFAKGRSKKGKPEPNISGEKHPRHKLTEDNVREVFARLAAGESQQSIADGFGVGQTAIQKISAGVNWGWLREGC